MTSPPAGSMPLSERSNATRRPGRPMGTSEGSGRFDSEADGGFADDEVIGLRGNTKNRAQDPMARAVPRVADAIGEQVVEEFEAFLEQ